MQSPPLRSLDLRRIRHFVVLADTLNFRRAAQLLHMTQPPLTVSIQKLEAELGIRLFDRDAKGVRLTPSGEAALGDARRVLQHAESFAQMAALAESGMAGALRIGFVGSASEGVLQRLIPRFRRTYPRVELLLRESSSMDITQALAAREIDVGLLWTPVLNAMGAEFQTLQQDHLVLALPRSHALAGRRRLSLADLRDESFILYDSHKAEGMRSVCMLLFQRAGFIPQVTQEAIQIKTVLALVQTGLGVALVPSLMRRAVGEGVVYRPLADLAGQPLIALSLGYRPDPPHPAVTVMRQLAQAEFSAPTAAPTKGR